MSKSFVKVEIHKVTSWASEVDAIKTSLHNVANNITQRERCAGRPAARAGYRPGTRNLDRSSNLNHFPAYNHFH